MINVLKKKIAFVLGLLFLILALTGILLPILPTTPFALLAVYFFDHSSEKFHAWVLKLPTIGKGVEDWKKERIIRSKAKIQSAILIGISSFIILSKEDLTVLVKSILILILLTVLTFLLSRRSK